LDRIFVRLSKCCIISLYRK